MTSFHSSDLNQCYDSGASLESRVKIISNRDDFGLQKNFNCRIRDIKNFQNIMTLPGVDEEQVKSGVPNFF